MSNSTYKHHKGPIIQPNNNLTTTHTRVWKSKRIYDSMVCEDINKVKYYHGWMRKGSVVNSTCHHFSFTHPSAKCMTFWKEWNMKDGILETIAIKPMVYDAHVESRLLYHVLFISCQTYSDIVAYLEFWSVIDARVNEVCTALILTKMIFRFCLRMHSFNLSQNAINTVENALPTCSIARYTCVYSMRTFQKQQLKSSIRCRS